MQRNSNIKMISLLFVALSAITYTCHGILLEHSLDGGSTWSKLSSVDHDSHKAEVALEREPVDMGALHSLAARDGFYLVRARGGKAGYASAFASASIRASAFTSGEETSERVDIHMDVEGGIVGIALSILHGPLSHAGAASGAARLPEKGSVRFLLPEPGPMVLSSTLTGINSAGGRGFGTRADYASASSTASNPLNRPKGQPSAGYPGRAQGDEGSQGEGASTQAPRATVEKTWWQKNWLVVMGIGMAGLNILLRMLSKLEPPPNAATNQKRPPASAGGRNN